MKLNGVTTADVRYCISAVAELLVLRSLFTRRYFSLLYLHALSFTAIVKQRLLIRLLLLLNIV